MKAQQFELREWAKERFPECFVPHAVQILDKTWMSMADIQTVFDLGKQIAAEEWSSEKEELKRRCAALEGHIGQAHELLKVRNEIHVKVSDTRFTIMFFALILLYVLHQYLAS